MCALGASYGGYMMNWIAGNWNEPFKCIVSHAGIFDTRGMGYTTEELWFGEWEHGGTPWEVPENYEKYNPLNHVAEWKQADAGDRTASTTTACRTRRACRCSTRCSGAAFRAACWFSRTRITGC